MGQGVEQLQSVVKTGSIDGRCWVNPGGMRNRPELDNNKLENGEKCQFTGGHCDLCFLTSGLDFRILNLV